MLSLRICCFGSAEKATPFPQQVEMIIQHPTLFPEIAQQLQPHLSHRISLSIFGNDPAVDGFGMECQDCHELLIEFLPASEASVRREPDTRCTRCGRPAADLGESDSDGLCE
jgi:hypothetical protein